MCAWEGCPHTMPIYAKWANNYRINKMTLEQLPQEEIPEFWIVMDSELSILHYM